MSHQLRPKRLTIVIDYLSEEDRRIVLRKLLIGDYKLPAVVGDGPPCKFSDKQLDGSERIRYNVSSKLEER